MSPPPKKLEIMAPAGDLACAQAAFTAGADSVYAGLADFNARQRANNFTVEELASLTAWARRHHRQVYITLNTLIKDTELKLLAEALDAIDRICPHAVIVQDIGTLRILRQYFSHLKIHASTQVGIHNSPGVAILQELGADRVILERQVTLDELKLIRQRTDVELEVFVHGALCCCLSGMCLFSSWMGGWSGNRGRCKQPCRRRFFTPEGNGFFFSTQDLYSLDLLPQLAELGIEAIKIEGRLREPSYVSTVVKAYRLMHDAAEKDRGTALKKARGLLGQTGGRKWSHGFRTKQDFETVVSPKRPGGSGKLCGKVDQVKANGFCLRPSLRINVGDTLRIQPPSGEAGPALEITMISNRQGKRVQSLAKGQTGLIHCDKDIVSGSSVYLTARGSKNESGISVQLEAVTKTVALRVKVSATGWTVTTLNLPMELSWQHEQDIPPAQKVALSKEKVQQAFSNGKQGTWRMTAIDITVEPGLFLQDKQLRHLRQDFVTWLQAQEAFHETNLTSQGTQRFLEAITTTDSPPPLLQPEQTIRQYNNSPPPTQSEIIAVPLDQDYRHAQEIILPAFCPETELSPCIHKIKTALKAGIKRLRITGLYQFKLLAENIDLKDIQLVTGFPLPACNRYAIQELQSLGAIKIMLWPELDQTAVETLAKQYGPSVELYRSGRLPILATRAEIPAQGQITGGHGQVFWVEREGGITYLYPDTQISLPHVAETSSYQNTPPHHSTTGTTSDFNYQREWL